MEGSLKAKACSSGCMRKIGLRMLEIGLDGANIDKLSLGQFLTYRIPFKQGGAFEKRLNQIPGSCLLDRSTGDLEFESLTLRMNQFNDEEVKFGCQQKSSRIMPSSREARDKGGKKWATRFLSKLSRT